MNHQGQSLRQSSQSFSSERETKAKPGSGYWGARVWTDDRVKQLISLFEEGRLSTTEIAAAMGGLTRNAVLGKLHRLGMRRPKPNQHPLESRVRSRPYIRVISERSERKPASRKRGTRAVEIEPHNLTIDRLERGHCRYPYGDGPFVFCGQNALEGSSYCPAHHALCYQPPKERSK